MKMLRTVALLATLIVPVAVSAVPIRTANAAWIPWDCRWVASSALINSGPMLVSGQSCIAFETTSLWAASWADSYPSMTAEYLDTRTWAFDTCAGGPYIAFAYSGNLQGPSVSYGTSNVGYGEYRDCADRHDYRMRGEMHVKPFSQGWDWAGGYWP